LYCVYHRNFIFHVGRPKHPNDWTLDKEFRLWAVQAKSLAVAVAVAVWHMGSSGSGCVDSCFVLGVVRNAA